MSALTPVAVVTVLICGACSSDIFRPLGSGSGSSSEEILCTREGWPSVVVELRNEAGAAAAWGATLILRDGAYADTSHLPWGPDGLGLGAGNRRPGTYTATVTKPGYHELVIAGIHVPAGPCGATHTVKVQGTLRLRPDAGPVRSVFVLHPSIGFGGPDHTLQLVAHVDAASGVSRDVVWSSSDTTVATVSATGVIRSLCREQTGNATITARSVADPSVAGTARVAVWPPHDGRSCTAGEATTQHVRRAQ